MSVLHRVSGRRIQTAVSSVENQLGELEKTYSPVKISLVYILFAGLIGGFAYNPYDPTSFAIAGLGLLEFENVYVTVPEHAIYPPSFFALLAVIFGLFELFTTVVADGFIAIAVQSFLGSTALALCYLFGRRVVPDRVAGRWMLATLFNPFVIIVTILVGQTPIYVALGVIAAISSMNDDTNSFLEGGLFLTIASSIKIYPSMIYLIYFIKNSGYRKEMVKGAAVIAAPTFAIMILLLPESVIEVLNPFVRYRPANSIYLFGRLLGNYPPPAIADALFKICLVCVTLLAIVYVRDKEHSLLLPMVPVVLLFPNLMEYRWLPLCMSALLVGYLPSDAASRRVTRYYGWAVVGLGTVAMFGFILEGWVEQMPGLVPTFGTLPPAPDLGTFSIGVGPFPDSSFEVTWLLTRISRMGIALLFILSTVTWSVWTTWQSLGE